MLGDLPRPLIVTGNTVFRQHKWVGVEFLQLSTYPAVRTRQGQMKRQYHFVFAWIKAIGFAKFVMPYQYTTCAMKTWSNVPNILSNHRDCHQGATYETGHAYPKIATFPNLSISVYISHLIHSRDICRIVCPGYTANNNRRSDLTIHRTGSTLQKTRRTQHRASCRQRPGNRSTGLT